MRYFNLDYTREYANQSSIYVYDKSHKMYDLLQEQKAFALLEMEREKEQAKLRKKRRRRKRRKHKA